MSRTQSYKRLLERQEIYFAPILIEILQNMLSDIADLETEIQKLKDITSSPNDGVPKATSQDT